MKGSWAKAPKIFNDVAYGEGYGMPDRALFLLVGIVTSVGLAAVFARFRPLAFLGQRTCPSTCCTCRC